jgi:hypothetical protein
MAQREVQTPMARPQRFVSVSVKFAGLLALLPLVAILALTYIHINTLTQAYEENLHRLGNSITQNVALLIENAVKGGDYSFQSTALQDTIGATADIEDGLILKGTAVESSYSLKNRGAISEERLRRIIEVQAREQVRAIPYSRGEHRYIDFVKDIYNGDQKYRTLVFGFSLARLDEKTLDAWISAGILTAVFFVIGTLTAILLGRRITRPLKELVQEAAKISSAISSIGSTRDPATRSGCWRRPSSACVSRSRARSPRSPRRPSASRARCRSSRCPTCCSSSAPRGGPGA